MSEQASAIDNLLFGLIDYAGLYPPASLDMSSAVRNYMRYLKGENSSLLGRFVVDLNRLPELCDIADNSICDIRLSIVAPSTTQWESLSHYLDAGLPIEAIEIKTSDPAEIKYIHKLIPSGIIAYFEVPISSPSKVFEAIKAIGARIKLRTGGVAADAFPSSAAIADMLEALLNHRISFKATAGLHHPIRGCHPFTYASDSPVGKMHGFLNLFLAAALLYFGGTAEDAKQLLEEESPGAFSISSNAIAWRQFFWTAHQLHMVRKEFAISFGSCSFEEPIHDLKALGWLS
jgi:hypothetical protein